MAKGCEWPDGCDLPDVPIYHVTKIDSNEIDGDYCRVHGYKRIRQMGRERRADGATSATPPAEGQEG
jgi:hypothetical protein